MKRLERKLEEKIKDGIWRIIKSQTDLPSTIKIDHALIRVEENTINGYDVGVYMTSPVHESILGVTYITDPYYKAGLILYQKGVAIKKWLLGLLEFYETTRKKDKGKDS